MAGEPELGPGDTGEWVTYLQQLLRQHSYPVDVNGDYDDATTGAVRQLQEVNALDVTGRTDAATWAALTGEATPMSSAAAASAEAAPGAKTFDPSRFPTFFGMYGVQGEQYVAALGIAAPAEGDDSAALA